jgi:hypothetical protein
MVGLPTRMGPAEFTGFGGASVAVPGGLAPLMQKAGGMWEPGAPALAAHAAAGRAADPRAAAASSWPSSATFGNRGGTNAAS